MILLNVLDHSHNYIEYLTLGQLSRHWNIYHSTTAYFFEPPCTNVWDGLFL